MGGGNISVLKTIPVKQIPLLLLKKRHEMTKKTMVLQQNTTGTI